jgi:hypothetical protein
MVYDIRKNDLEKKRGCTMVGARATQKRVRKALCAQKTAEFRARLKEGAREKKRGGRRGLCEGAPKQTSL